MTIIAKKTFQAGPGPPWDHLEKPGQRWSGGPDPLGRPPDPLRKPVPLAGNDSALVFSKTWLLFGVLFQK